MMQVGREDPPSVLDRTLGGLVDGQRPVRSVGHGQLLK
jgi:hypothetical protein